MNKDSIKDYTNSLASDRKTTITQLINVIEQNIPKGFERLFSGISENQFRVDISSTELRNQDGESC